MDNYNQPGPNQYGQNPPADPQYGAYPQNQDPYQQYGYQNSQYNVPQQQYDYSQQQYDPNGQYGYGQQQYAQQYPANDPSAGNYAYYPPPSAPPAGNSSEKEKKSGYLFVLLGILCFCLLAVVGICVYVFVFKDDTPAASAVTMQTEVFTISAETEPYIYVPQTEAKPTETEPKPTETEPKPTEPEYLDLHLSSDYIDFKVPVSGFVIEDSDTRRIKESELYSMTEHQVCVARNEIFARHGRKFKDKKLSEYFNALDWYYGRIEAATFDANSSYYLNSIEQDNIKTIVAYESKMGW